VSSPVTPESDEVLAFIAERRAGVLERARADLSTSAPEDLAGLAHRLTGTLGTYRLDDARDAVVALLDIARDPTATAADVEAVRARTVTALDAIARTLGMSETP